MTDIVETYGHVIKKQAAIIGKKFLPYIKSRVDMDDLISEATLIALQKLPTFDPERGDNIESYLGIQIHYGLLKYATQNMYDLSAPYTAVDKANKRGDGKAFLYRNTAYRIGEDENNSRGLLSEDSAVFASGCLPPIDLLEHDDDVRILRETLETLDKNEKLVLEQRIMAEDTKTQQEVAQQINVHHITISDIEDKAKEKMRIRMKAKHGH